MSDLLTALVVLVVCVVLGVLMRKPAERLVVFLKNRNPRQMNFLIALALLAVVIEIIIFGTY